MPRIFSAFPFETITPVTMAKEALIKIRCSEELKRRLKKLADAHEQTLSDFIRQRLITEFKSELLDRDDGNPNELMLNEPNSDFGYQKKGTKDSRRRPRSVPAAGKTG